MPPAELAANPDPFTCTCWPLVRFEFGVTVICALDAWALTAPGAGDDAGVDDTEPGATSGPTAGTEPTEIGRGTGVTGPGVALCTPGASGPDAADAGPAAPNASAIAATVGLPTAT